MIDLLFPLLRSSHPFQADTKGPESREKADNWGQRGSVLQSISAFFFSSFRLSMDLHLGQESKTKTTPKRGFQGSTLRTIGVVARVRGDKGFERRCPDAQVSPEKGRPVGRRRGRDARRGREVSAAAAAAAKRTTSRRRRSRRHAEHRRGDCRRRRGQGRRRARVARHLVDEDHRAAARYSRRGGAVPRSPSKCDAIG